MHHPVLYKVSAPDAGSLAALADGFQQGDIAYVAGLGAFAYQTLLPQIEPIGTIASVEGGFWIPSAALASFASIETTREFAQPTLLNKNVYLLPMGSYVAADPQDARVFLTVGAVTAELPYSAVPLAGAWMFSYPGIFSGNAVRPSVRDVANGVISAAGAFPAGATLTIRWVERLAPFRPRSLTPQYLTRPNALVDFAADPSQPWIAKSATSAPNAIVVPPGPPGFVPELWRLTRKLGGHTRNTSPNTFFTNGRRFVPYFRGPQPEVSDPNTFLLNESNAMFPTASPFGTPNNQRLRFRVCYYNPTTRARSHFAPEVAFVFKAYAGDRHSMGTLRVSGIVYVSPA
jgi:hypothetical protein